MSLRYADPWAANGQPRLEWLDRGWFRRDKALVTAIYGVRIPDWVLDEIPACPEIVWLPAGFVCDVRSSPTGLILTRAHPAGLLHDWLYRAPSYLGFLKRGDLDVLENAQQVAALTRAEADYLFWAHLRDTGRRQSLVHWNPWNMRAFHALTRLPQYWAVRLGGGKPWEEHRDGYI